MTDRVDGLANLIADTSMRAQSDAERRLLIRSAVEHACSEGMVEMTEVVKVRPPNVDTRFRQMVAHWNNKDAHQLEALYFEMKAELSEDLGFYLGRMKQLEIDNARLREQLGRLVLALANADKSDVSSSSQERTKK